MADALLIPKDQAIALLVALGFKTAKKKDCKKLTEMINAIEEAPDEPMETEELDALMDSLMGAEEAVVVEDADEEVDDVDEDEDEVVEDEDDDIDEDENDDADDDGEEDEDEDEDEEVKPKKNNKKDKKKTKSKTKTKEKKTVKKEKKESFDSATLELLQTKPMKIETLVKALLKRFPDADEEKLTRTTKRRVTGHLQNKYGVKITKSKNGAYSVEE